MRDRLLALGFHRPTRIKSSDFSTLDLNDDDFENVVLLDSHHLVGARCPTLKSSSRQRLLAEISQQRAQLGPIVEEILTIQTAYSKAKDVEHYCRLHNILEEQFMKAEKSLKAWKESLPDSCCLDSAPMTEAKSLEVLRIHLHLLYFTMVYSLQRLRFLPTSPSMISATPHAISSESRAQTLAAASQIGRIATKLKETHLDRYLPVSGLTVIFPAIVVSLLQLKWDGKYSQEAKERLQACTAVVETMQMTYAAADASMAYLGAAMRKASLDDITQGPATPPMQPATVNRAGDNTQLLVATVAESANKAQNKSDPDFGEVGNSIENEFDPAMTSSAAAGDLGDNEATWPLNPLPSELGNDRDGEWLPSLEWDLDTSFLDSLLDLQHAMEV